MSNSYKYIDPDFTYTDPETGLLRNILDITDPDVLLFVESGAVTKGLQELYENPITPAYFLHSRMKFHLARKLDQIPFA